MKGEQIVHGHSGMKKSFFQGATKAQWMWTGFIGCLKRIKDLESGGKMKSKQNWNAAELVLRLKRLELRVGFHGLFQHETMKSNRRRGHLKLHNPTFTSFMFLNERRGTKNKCKCSEKEKLCSASDPLDCLLFNSLYCTSACLNGGKGRGMD